MSPYYLFELPFVAHALRPEQRRTNVPRQQRRTLVAPPLPCAYIPITAHVISHVVVLPSDLNDLERFEPRLLLATECFVSLFSALRVDL